MKKGDKVIFIKKGWESMEYGSQYTILNISYLPSRKNSNETKECFLISYGEGEYYVRSKNFISLKESRQMKLKKLQNYI